MFIKLLGVIISCFVVLLCLNTRILKLEAFYLVIDIFSISKSVNIILCNTVLFSNPGFLKWNYMIESIFLRKKSKNTNFFNRNATQLKPCLGINQIKHAFFILFGNYCKRGSRLVRYYGHLDFRWHVFNPILEQCVSMLCYQYFRYFNFISSSWLTAVCSNHETAEPLLGVEWRHRQDECTCNLEARTRWS